MKKETRTMVKILHNSAKVSTTFDQILSGVFLKVPVPEMIKQMDSKNKEIKKVVLEMVKVLREDGYIPDVDTPDTFEEAVPAQVPPEPVVVPPDPSEELSKILGEEQEAEVIGEHHPEAVPGRPLESEVEKPETVEPEPEVEEDKPPVEEEKKPPVEEKKKEE